MATPAPAGGAGPQVLMGGGPGQFNLEAVRVRAAELRTSISEVLHALRVNPNLLQWDAILKQYANINLQVMALREALRGVLRQTVVHPCLVDNPALSQSELSSAVLPEQAEAERQLLVAEEARLASRGVSRECWYEATDIQLDEFNKMITALTGPGGCLDPQGEGRKSMSTRSVTITRSLTAVRQGVLPPPPGPTLGTKRGRSSHDAHTGGLDPALRQLLTGEASKTAR